MQASKIAEHEVRQHLQDANKLSFRQRCLDPASGRIVWQSIHFNATLYEVKKMYDENRQVVIDMESKTLRYKRKLDDGGGSLQSVIIQDSDVVTTETELQENNGPTDDELLKIVRPAFDLIQEQGRGEDFLSVLTSIANGTLPPTNITLQLLLDIGPFLSVEKVSNVRYNSLIMNFWATLYKLFKGKALRFFRGYMAGGTSISHDEDRLLTENCQFNMIVPSVKSIRRHTTQYKVETANSSIIQSSLDTFSASHKDKEFVKICIDGKKLSYGIGKLGEEDLCGHESAQTSTERRERLEKEMDKIDGIFDQVDLDRPLVENLNKLQLLDVIAVLSQRIRDLREFSTVKKEHFTTCKQKLKVIGNLQTRSINQLSSL